MQSFRPEHHTWRALQSLVPPLELQTLIVAGQVVWSHS